MFFRKDQTMVTPKSGTYIRGRSRQRDKQAGKKKFLEMVTSIGAGSGPLSTVLRRYKKAIAVSRATGKAVSFRVVVDARGGTDVTPLGEAAVASARATEKSVTRDPDLEAALSAARARGRLRAAEILEGDDMLSADQFAKRLGASRVTVNAKRRSGHVLGLEGAKRGFRFPVWQLDAEDKPYTVLAKLHQQLGGPWAVYRFLVQPHDELNGLTGLAALERGKNETALEAAESIGKDFG
jgi:hypothetical protein